MFAIRVHPLHFALRNKLFLLSLGLSHCQITPFFPIGCNFNYWETDWKAKKMKRAHFGRTLIASIISIICAYILVIEALTVGDTCSTPCDCHKRSSSYDTANMHLCFDCSALHNQTCQITAACSRGHICTIDPNSRVNEYRCLPPDASETCVTDRDCHKGNYYNNTRQAVSYLGHCLPNGKCRYLLYGIGVGEIGITQPASHTFEHSTCQLEQTKCKTVEDCFNLKQRNSAIGVPYVMCESGSCIIAAPSRFSTTEGINCDTERDCENYASTNDPDHLHSCYACVKTAQAGFTEYPVKLCVKTNANCASGMCLHGQCLAKQCQHHVDCIEVAGVSGRHCHKCDSATHLCTANHICPYGKYCTIDFRDDHKCSGLVKECRRSRNVNDVFREAGGSNRFCVPTSSEVGYYRTSDFLHSDLTQRVLDSLLRMAQPAAPTPRREGEPPAKPSIISTFTTASNLLTSQTYVAEQFKVQEDPSVKLKKEAEAPQAKPIVAAPTERGVAINRLGTQLTTNSIPIATPTAPPVVQEQPQSKLQTMQAAPQQAQQTNPKVTTSDIVVSTTTTPPSTTASGNAGWITLIVICPILIILIIVGLWKLWKTEESDAKESQYTKDFEQTSSSKSSSSGSRRDGKPRKDKRLAIRT